MAQAQVRWVAEHKTHVTQVMVEGQGVALADRQGGKSLARRTTRTGLEVGSALGLSKSGLLLRHVFDMPGVAL